MKIEGNYTIKASREKVWNVLMDPKIIAQCIPGCEGLDEVGPDEYEASVKIGVASIKATYKTHIAIRDKQPPNHYVLSGGGLAGPGFVEGSVAIDLEENNGQTLLKYSADAKLGGVIAGIGQRMLGGIARMMVGEFFKKVEGFV
ncbi:MAG: carbon monoxide dehydrogenase subunit G [Candidatus Binatia bacterium]|jgi:hypothetical protein|nr:carbon monoxide dehydrogenase subunit G [Candidatus Binatia bacterium]